MKQTSNQNGFPSGATLIEAVIAVGVLAIAVPLVMGTIAEAGKSGMAAEAETRSTWMISTCMTEINASRVGQSRYFPPTITGQSFPAAGDVWALAFSPEGKPVGKISKSNYDQGTKEIDGKPVRFIAELSAVPQTTASGGVPMLKTRISIQYPAAAPASKRGNLDYHTLIP
jgi:type II secretory pathway pseudopilin PulG